MGPIGNTLPGGFGALFNKKPNPALLNPSNNFAGVNSFMGKGTTTPNTQQSGGFLWSAPQTYNAATYKPQPTDGWSNAFAKGGALYTPPTSPDMGITGYTAPTTSPTSQPVTHTAANTSTPSGGFYSPYTGNFLPYGTNLGSVPANTPISYSTATGQKLYTPPNQQTNTQSTQNNQNTTLFSNPQIQAAANGTANPTGISGTFASLINKQGNTQPYGSITNAGNTLYNTSTGNNLTGQQYLNQQNVNTAAQTSANIAANQTPAVTAAENAYNQYAQGIAPYLSAMQNDPTFAADVSRGLGQIATANIGNILQQKQQAVTNALAGQQQQLTGAQQQGALGQGAQNAAIAAAEQAGQLGNVAQGNQITAQQNATNNLLNSLAQQGYVIINKTTGQPLSTQGAIQAAYSGGQTSAAETAGSNTFAMNQANTAAKGIQGTIQQFIAANPQLNSSPSTLANAAEQWLQGKQLGDPKYQTLFNYLNEYTNTLAPILGVGGDTTNLKTQIAQGFINSQASGQDISQVLSSIGQLADQKLANLESAGQGGGQVAGGTPVGGTPTSFGQSW